MPEEDSIKIKDYVIHQPPLGEGTYGRVFRATYRGISDRALKIFRPGAVDLTAMARELEKLSQVSGHPGIVTLHDFDLLNDPPYYAMGLHAFQMPDGSWDTHTLVKYCGRVDHREAWRLIRDIADAVSYLHRNRIIHCDLKPSNILLTDEVSPHVKICDFGQSRGLVAEGALPVGTPLYASPEQLRNPRDSADGKGFRWDVYSFGVVAYQLITGELPRLKRFVSTADQAYFDPDATLYELGNETAEGDRGKAIDSNQIATLVEATEEIVWPSGLKLSSERRLLIEQCLSLDPLERPSDMREVWNRIQNLDQQVAVRRARKLNTIFAVLLVIAIWASGFALIQAMNAHQATEKEKASLSAAEKSADAAFDLMLLFMNELNRGDISGSGANRLYATVAEHSQTFLDNREKNTPASKRVLRFSAQTATVSGRNAQKENNLEGALKYYKIAFEIRSKLAEDGDSSENLSRTISRDLVNIADVYERMEDYPNAISHYAEALEWMSQSRASIEVFSLSQVIELAKIYRALAKVYSLTKDYKQATSTLNEILVIITDRIQDSEAPERFDFTEEALRISLELGEYQQAAKELTKAIETYEKALELTSILSNASPSVAENAEKKSFDIYHFLGMIRLNENQLEAALTTFQTEIRLREDLVNRREHNIEAKIGLIAAYEGALRCFTTREIANPSFKLYLDKANVLIETLPSDVRSQDDLAPIITKIRQSSATSETAPPQ